MKRRKFVHALSVGALSSILPSQPMPRAMQFTGPSPDSGDPGSTEDILKPLGSKTSSSFNAATRSQLFVDKILIREERGVFFTPHSAQKQPVPVMRADRPWEGWRICLFGNVIYDREEKIFKMWYLGETGKKARVPYFPQTEYNQTLYATSTNGINWEKPLVGTIPAARGETFAHNCVALVEQPNAFKDPADPDPERRYKMITFIGDPREGRGYYTMISPDGLRWRVYSPSAIAPSRDNINGFYDARRELYIAFPKISTKISGHLRRVYYVMGSKNFQQWGRPVMSFAPDLRDDVGAMGRLERFRSVLNEGINPQQIRSEFYGLGFYQSESCTLGFPWVLTVNDNDRFGNQDGITEIQLAVSHDLISWNRPFRLPCITQGNPGEWDSGFITTANEALRIGDEVWLYYSGSNYSHGCPCFYENDDSGQGTKYTASIGLAKWKLDRFVSVDGPAEGGTVDTVPLNFSGTRLEVNAAVKSGGSLTVQVLDPGGRPLPGFGISEPFRGDELRHTVRWKGTEQLASLIGKPISLRFRISQGSLFAFAFRET